MLAIWLESEMLPDKNALKIDITLRIPIILERGSSSVLLHLRSCWSGGGSRLLDIWQQDSTSHTTVHDQSHQQLSLWRGEHNLENNSRSCKKTWIGSLIINSSLYSNPLKQKKKTIMRISYSIKTNVLFNEKHRNYSIMNYFSIPLIRFWKKKCVLLLWILIYLPRNIVFLTGRMLWSWWSQGLLVHAKAATYRVSGYCYWKCFLSRLRWRTILALGIEIGLACWSGNGIVHASCKNEMILYYFYYCDTIFRACI